MLRTRELKDHTFDEIGPWGSILHAIAWGINSTYHTTTQASLGQLVFGRDILFNIPYGYIKVHSSIISVQIHIMALLVIQTFYW